MLTSFIYFMFAAVQFGRMVMQEARDRCHTTFTFGGHTYNLWAGPLYACRRRGPETDR